MNEQLKTASSAIFKAAKEVKDKNDPAVRILVENALYIANYIKGENPSTCNDKADDEACKELIQLGRRFVSWVNSQ